MQALILTPPDAARQLLSSVLKESPAAAELASLYRQRKYDTVGTVKLPNCTKVGEDAAEEVFDLTNNPSRQDEREQAYGRGRSVSVGDIVIICETGGAFLCASCGWITIE